jgi:VanZ family protein
MKIQIKTYWPAVFGLVAATMLFCLPGEEFPEAGWLEDIQLDKIVHVGLFFTLVVLWCLPSGIRTNQQRINRVYLYITLAFFAYGIAIEFIQRDFVPHRSFDFFDIVADTIGCVTGFVVARKIS